MVFSPGIKITKAKRKPKRVTFISEGYPVIPPVSVPLPTGWLLRTDLGLCETIMLNNRKTITAVLHHLNQLSHDSNKYSTINQFCPTPIAKRNMINRCIILASDNQRMRTAFQNLARRWLMKHIKHSNEEDLHTGEVPKKLVTIYDWKKRCVYNFEAATILRDMTSRLMNHSYLFPKFLLPRNPYTNIDLSMLEFYAVMKQLRAHGLTNWKLEALLETRYNMAAFKEKFADSVRHEIIDRQFNDLSSEETIDIILEFVEDQHAIHGCAFNRFIYRWILENTKCTSVRILFWIKTCKKYNMLSATCHDPHVLFHELTDLELTTKKFCSPPIELIRKREAQFKKALLPTDDAIEDLEGLIASLSFNNEILDA